MHRSAEIVLRGSPREPLTALRLVRPSNLRRINGRFTQPSCFSGNVHADEIPFETCKTSSSGSTVKSMRLLHIFTTWDAPLMEERGFTGLLGELASRGFESHLLCEGTRGDIPGSLVSCRRARGLHGGGGEESWARLLPELLSAVRPHAVWIHDDVQGRIVHRLNRPNRDYGLWWWIHDHRMDCMTGLRAKTGGRKICAASRSPSAASMRSSGVSAGADCPIGRGSIHSPNTSPGSTCSSRYPWWTTSSFRPNTWRRCY